MMLTPDKEFWDVFKKREGALSCAESIAIMNIAALAKEGEYMELGSYKLKSAMSAVMGLKDGTFWLVDPLFLDEKFSTEVIKNFMFRMNMVLVGGYSTSEIDRHGPYSYVFVDSGSHSDDLPMTEAKMLEDRMIDGGIIAFHDYLNQFVRVKEAYDYLVSTGKYEPVHIDWQPIFDYVNEHNLEDGNSSWHQYPDLGHPPNFVGAVKRIK